MAKLSLTNIKISKLQPKAQEFTIADGFNLYLLVKPTGAKLWRFIYNSPATGKRKKLSLGKYPFKSLADAREIAQKYYGLLQDGICPFEYEQEQERLELEQQKRSESLQSFAYKWAKWKLSKGKAKAETIDKSMQRLEKHLFPRFNGYTLEQFTITDAIERLQDLEAVMPDTLNRVLGNFIEIMDYAMLCGRIPHNPIAPIKKAFATVESTHQPTIPPHELADFMHALQKSNRTPQIKLLVEWQLVTMLRPFEAVGVRWEDVDFENKLLTIPAERMKGGKRGHSVPLSEQALQILEEMRKYNGHLPYIFAGRNDRTQPANSQTVNNAIKRIEQGKYKGILTAHGLRSIASTYLNERFTDEPLVIEACLSHVGKDAVRNAYFRGSYINRRKELMQAWGDFIEQCKKG